MKLTESELKILRSLICGPSTAEQIRNRLSWGHTPVAKARLNQNITRLVEKRLIEQATGFPSFSWAITDAGIEAIKKHKGKNG